MDRLTTNQITDFNNPLAFARGRELRAGQTPLDAVSNNNVQTSDIEESYRLVSGASTRLETLAGNLETMLGLAQSGQRIRGDQRKLEETYGRLRSLSAGFDQVVGAIKFNGTSVFDGKKLALDLGPGTRSLNHDAAKLLTYGENSLGLSESTPTAEVTLRYGADDAILNKAYSLVGLEIESGEYLSGKNSSLELEDGQYKVRVTYLGENSTVEIQNKEGVLLEKKEAVDLSGDGSEWVDFELGLRLTFSKEQLLESFDKYDFESNGPAYLNATMLYRRLDSHTLRTEDSSASEDGVEFRFTPQLSNSNGGNLQVSEAELASVAEGKTALATGDYTIDVHYLGENSYVRLTDSLGQLKGYQYGVDLSQSGTTKIDFGVGLSFEIENDGYSGENRMTIPLTYTRQPSAIDTFDFKEYAARIQAAIEIVNEERIAMEDAMTQIEETNSMRNFASSQSVPNSRTLNATGAINILTPNSEPGVFDSQALSARTSLLANQLFTTTTALPTQANQSTESLSSLSRSSASDFLGSFI